MKIKPVMRMITIILHDHFLMYCIKFFMRQYWRAEKACPRGGGHALSPRREFSARHFVRCEIRLIGSASLAARHGFQKSARRAAAMEKKQ
ncbi:hypothetical protein [Methylocystis iwaonis]|uniref:hypothetical protein n=1 Tax=Methylocystis iwaonis TaxID=2885079 RepID=UPI002E7B3D96|nr:hypothetical protein [Methylocystis iwaonis]